MRAQVGGQQFEPFRVIADMPQSKVAAVAEYATVALRGVAVVDDRSLVGATAVCATCALCWQSDRNIAFLRH